MVKARINLTKPLGVKPEKVFSYLVVKLGDKVIKGQLLAIKKGVLGKKEIRSPEAGRLSKYEEDSGCLILEEEEEKEETPRRESLLEGEFGLGKGQGWLFYQTNYLFPKLSAALKGKIVLTRKKVRPITLYRAASLGVSGIICGRLSDQDQQEFLKRKETFKGIGLLACDFEKIEDKLGNLKQNQEVILEGEGKTLYCL